MALINEGDVIEGIFALALGLFLAYGKVDKAVLNKHRTLIDPAKFSAGRLNVSIAKNVKRQSGKHPPDFFNVEVQIRLKAASVGAAFGKQYKVLYEKASDVGEISRKVDALIAATHTASFAAKAKAAVNEFLNNNYGEIVNFTVVSDGIAGESSGGDIKGDVMLQIEAVRKGQKKVLARGPIAFSLKSNSVTVANLSPFKGMLEIAKALGVKWDAKTKYDRLRGSFQGPKEQAEKFKMIVKMYQELQAEIKKVSVQGGFTDRAMDFLEHAIFGSDLADVIDIRSQGVREITKAYVDALRANKLRLVVETKGDTLVFVDQKSGVAIFQVRTKLRRPPANEAKFYLEVGHGIYAPGVIPHV